MNMINLPKYYNIGWCKISDVLEKFPNGFPKNGYLGICGKTGQSCKLVSSKSVLNVLIIVDFYVKDGVCEEGERCINSHCELNRTNAKTFGESNRWGQKAIKKAESVNFPHNLDDLTRIEIVKPQE